MATKLFNLYSNSADKFSGTNNNAMFNVNWESFLLRDFDAYQINFSFNATAGYYKDTNNTIVYSHCKIVSDYLGRSYSYDTSVNDPSITLGIANGEPSTATSNTTGFNVWVGYNPNKTIARPTQNFINVKIYNLETGLLLTDTMTGGVPVTDMTMWNIIITFTPITRLVNSERFPNIISQ